jgi:hypothetical protein
MLYWASTQVSGPILEGFGPISYHFRDSWTACNAWRARNDPDRGWGEMSPIAARNACAYLKRMYCISQESACAKSV